ncbi:MAG: heavy metal translocating P-type ATPase [Eubacterium sp.]|nr:heavy metal translocating P-type ATPase [Eubacterium sp.]
MRCKILHESKTRIRIKLIQYRMNFEQADILENYLCKVKGVTDVKVHERTCVAIITHKGQSRAAIIDAMSQFDYEENKDLFVGNSSRKLQHEFENKMCLHIGSRLCMKLFIPPPIRIAVTIVKAIPFIARGLKALMSGKLEVSVLDATSILVSLIRKDFSTAGTVMFMLGVGEIMEEWTHRKSINDLAKAMELNVEKVWTRAEDGTEILVDADSIEKDDIIIVRTGNIIAVDGKVVEGDAYVSQASITGESMPVHKYEDSPVYAGTVVEEGEIVIRADSAPGSSKYDRIISMIEASEKLKSATEDEASKLADRLVPYTFAATALQYLISGDVIRASSILMVDFSCALKLSIPIAVLSAMRESGNHHMTVKGGKFLEAVAEADTIVFDKTGTLTEAAATVKAVIPFSKLDEAECLRLAACLEEHYPHSIANAVVDEAKRRGLTHEEKHSKVEYVVAHGIVSSIENQRVLIGSRHFVFEDEACKIADDMREKFDNLPNEYSHLYLAIENELAAVLLIEDPIKAGAAEVIAKLKQCGFKHTVMMTGDNDRTAKVIAEKVGVDAYYAEVLPEDKANFIKEQHRLGRKVIMVGDGINDSPALSEANAGIAINSGAAIAREVADIMIGSDNLEELVTLRKISTGLMKRIKSSYNQILGFNSFLIVMGILGLFTPTVTASLHNASTLAISLRNMTDIEKKNK